MSSEEDRLPPEESTVTDQRLLDASLRQWEVAVENQRHFNEIEWKIRALALTSISVVVTFSSTGYLARSVVAIGKLTVPASGFLLIGAGVIWYIFYFVDYYWYHPLLIASTRTANENEKVITSLIGSSGLSTNITEASHNQWFGKTLRSTTKLRIFYGLGAFLIVLAFIAVVWASNR